MLGITPSPTPLDRDTFNKHFDHLLSTGKLNPDIIPLLDRWQMYAVNEAKKAINRISKQS